MERARVVYLAPPPDPMNPVVQVRFHLQIVNSSHMTKRITELLSVHYFDFILVIISKIFFSIHSPFIQLLKYRSGSKSFIINPRLPGLSLGDLLHTGLSLVERHSYCMSKKSLPILFSNLLYKVGQDILNIQ